MTNAAQTDQWPVIEILIDHGADVWPHDEFGITAAQRTITSRILRLGRGQGAAARDREAQGAGLSFPATRP